MMLVSEFGVKDLYSIGGNDGGWLQPYLPNVLSCQDRPTVVPPPAPSPWRGF